MKKVGYLCDGCGKTFPKGRLHKTKEYWSSHMPFCGSVSGVDVNYLCRRCLEEFITKKSDGSKLDFARQYNKLVCTGGNSSTLMVVAFCGAVVMSFVLGLMISTVGWI